jgi:hypothetical protein
VLERPYRLLVPRSDYALQSCARVGRWSLGRSTGGVSFCWQMYHMPLTLIFRLKGCVCNANVVNDVQNGYHWHCSSSGRMHICARIGAAQADGSECITLSIQVWPRLLPIYHSTFAETLRGQTLCCRSATKSGYGITTALRSVQKNLKHDLRMTISCPCRVE